MNVAHQLGGSLGLGALVAVAAAVSDTGSLGARALKAHRIGTALTAGAALLALALVVVVALIVRPRKGTEAAVGAGSSDPVLA